MSKGVPELQAAVARILEAVDMGRSAGPMAPPTRTTLSALATAFAFASAGRAYIVGTDAEEQAAIAAGDIAEFNRLVPAIVAEHLEELREIEDKEREGE